MEKTQQNKFEVLTGRDQILKKPTMWIGAIDPTEKEMFVIDDDHVEYKSITYIPAFRKIFDEILDNALDALIEHCNSSGSIKVKIDDEKISVEDDGPGIPVVKKQLTESELKSLPKEEAEQLKDSYIPFIAWTRLFSGTNFQESDEKMNIGSHGVGSKAAAIFSTKFVGTTDDGKKKCIVKALDNLGKTSCKVEDSSGTSGTLVEFWPDLKRFNLSKIDSVYQDLAYQRLLCLAMTFPNMKFSFNGKRIYVNDKKFLKMFSDNIEFATFDKGFVGIYPNPYDDFKFLTYVDGMYMARGGNHVEYIINQIVNPIRDKLVKKYKTIKPADIRNKFTLVCFMREFPNPKFDSQTKDTLSNSQSEITSYLNGKIDFEKFAKDILKNDALIDPIVETFKIKEELKARQELKKVKKIKVKSDKYMSPIGEQKYLALVEGNSAASGLQATIGRENMGYFACRGLPINAYSQSIQKIVQNEEFKTIMSILDLDVSSKDTNKQISFEKILIATDADIDGSHLTSMFLGWFKRFAENLFDEGKICRLNIPLVLLVDKNERVVEHFFNLADFNNWEKQNTNHKYHVEYWKGLGSISKKLLNQLLVKYGLEYFIETYRMDESGKIYLDHWLNDKTSDKRKEYLKQHQLDINSI